MFIARPALNGSPSPDTSSDAFGMQLLLLRKLRRRKASPPKLSSKLHFQGRHQASFVCSVPETLIVERAVLKRDAKHNLAVYCLPQRPGTRKHLASSIKSVQSKLQILSWLH